MGAHTPDAYRYGDYQLPREYPRSGGRPGSSPSARSVSHRGACQDDVSSAVQSSPFAPREQQVVAEREYAHHDEVSAGASPASSPFGSRGRRDERVEVDRGGSAYPSAPAQPAPRLVSVEQMYVPIEEVQEARRRQALAYRDDEVGTRTDHREPPRKKRRWKLGLGMFSLGFFMGIIATVVSVFALAALMADGSTNFAAAVNTCQAFPYAQVSSDGTSMEMTTSGKKEPGMSVRTLGCLLEELDAPTSLKQRMESTRAIDGTQEEKWGSYRATWTYHPDHGLHVVVSRE